MKNGARDRIKRWDKSGYNLPRKAINLYNEEPPTRKVGEIYEPGAFGSGEVRGSGTAGWGAGRLGGEKRESEK